ncbi:hypothetical protein Ple7327_2640 [Pleurocapsa sp. PCC 7327]|nr:hypothetical protein Ple7327_2640 [Pleurocapsa sp. PCC 7327]
MGSIFLNPKSDWRGISQIIIVFAKIFLGIFVSRSQFLISHWALVIGEKGKGKRTFDKGQVTKDKEERDFRPNKTGTIR